MTAGLSLFFVAFFSVPTFAVNQLVYQELLRVQCVRRIEVGVRYARASYACDTSGAMDPRSRAYLDNNPEHVYKTLGDTQAAAETDGTRTTSRTGIIECYATAGARTHCESLSVPSEDQEN